MIQEILSEVNRLGFFPDEITTDGKLKRFKRSPQDKHKDAWCTFYENYTQTGDKYYFFVGGDWREPGLLTKVCSKKKLTTVEKKLLEIQIEETKKLIEEEQQKLRAQCVQECEHIWSTAQEFTDTDYTIKKKIKGDFKVKTKLTNQGRVLIVPVKNIDDKLVGLQKIYPDGKKYFHPGTAKKGAFHLIGDHINGEAYLCEGFATAASIHMATKKPTIVAFDAGNLVEVSKEIRRKHKDTKLIICGDDDKWTENNPGRTMAELAATSTMAMAVFPEFQTPKEGKTDFNDLHVEEGLEKVKNILTGVHAEKHYLKPLGVHGDKFFYISSQGNRVTSLTAGTHNKNNLFSLMPLQYWETMYENKKGIRWDQAFSDLISECQSVGPFNPEKIRGVGVWKDKGRLLINMGSGLYCDNKEYSIGELETKYIYQAGPKIKPPVANDLTTQECFEKLIKTVSVLNWKKEESGYLLLGFVALARFCGALQWRPHIWLTGGFGAGKSSIMEFLIRPLLGDISIYLHGSTTEAGMRQSIGYDTRPVIFDEFETDDEKTSDIRIKAAVAFVRQASSESDARIVKGSAGGTAVDYKATFCAIVSSIRVNLTNAADKSRFSVLEVEKVNRNSLQWDSVKKQLDMLTPDFSDRLFSRIYHMWPIVQENIKLLQRAIAQKHDQRMGQQYGTLLAGYQALVSDSIVTDEEITRLLGYLDSEDKDVHHETDEMDCWDHMVNSKARLQWGNDNLEQTIGFYILKAKEEPLFTRIILSLGIKYENGFVYIANNHVALKSIFKDTKWKSGWSHSLSRIKGAEKTTPVRFGISLSRAIKLPIEMFRGD